MRDKVDTYVPFKLEVKIDTGGHKNDATHYGSYYRPIGGYVFYVFTKTGDKVILSTSKDFLSLSNKQQANEVFKQLENFVSWLGEKGAPASVFEDFLKVFTPAFHLNFYTLSTTEDSVIKNSKDFDLMMGLSIYQKIQTGSLFSTAPKSAQKLVKKSWVELQKLDSTNKHDEWAELLNPTFDKEFENQEMIERFMLKMTYPYVWYKYTDISEYQRSLKIKWLLIMSMILKGNGNDKIIDYLGEAGKEIFREYYDADNDKIKSRIGYSIHKRISDFPSKKYLLDALSDLTVSETRDLVNHRYGAIDKSATVKYLEKYIQKIKNGETKTDIPKVPFSEIVLLSTQFAIKDLDEKNIFQFSNALNSVASFLSSAGSVTDIGKLVFRDWLQYHLDADLSLSYEEIAKAFKIANGNSKSYCTTSGASEKIIIQLYNKTNGNAVFVMELLFEATKKPKSYNQWVKIIDSLSKDLIGLPPAMILESCV